MRGAAEDGHGALLVFDGRELRRGGGVVPVVEEVDEAEGSVGFAEVGIELEGAGGVVAGERHVLAGVLKVDGKEEVGLGEVRPGDGELRVELDGLFEVGDGVVELDGGVAACGFFAAKHLLVGLGAGGDGAEHVGRLPGIEFDSEALDEIAGDAGLDGTEVVAFGKVAMAFDDAAVGHAAEFGVDDEFAVE
jgi:hypothetical protein